MDDLIDVCVKHMAGEGFTEEQARAYMKGILPNLDYWKNRKDLEDGGKFEQFKKQLIEEFNALDIKGMPKVEKLNALVGSYVNLVYTLPGGMTAKFLDDSATYLGNQLEAENGRFFGVLGNADFLMVSTYGIKGAEPELILYKKR
jgi:hypothetical protein